MTKSEILDAIAISEAAGNTKTPIPNHILRALCRVPYRGGLDEAAPPPAQEYETECEGAVRRAGRAFTFAAD